MAIDYHKSKRKWQDGKDTVVFVNGVAQNPKKLQRQANRYRNRASIDRGKQHSSTMCVILRSKPYQKVFLYRRYQLSIIVSSVLTFQSQESTTATRRHFEDSSAKSDPKFHFYVWAICRIIRTRGDDGDTISSIRSRAQRYRHITSLDGFRFP